MKILVTGAEGFIGKNLIIKLNELGIEFNQYTRSNSPQDLPYLLENTKCVVHLAGENRPLKKEKFDIVNAGLTESLCEAIRIKERKIPIIFSSSSQAILDNAYGESKLKAETIIRKLSAQIKNQVYIYRLPGVFGKWCKPNYNSVVATFCHNISHNLPIKVNDTSVELELVYIDDVISEFISIIQGEKKHCKNLTLQPSYKITLGDLANQIKHFRESRTSLVSEKVGTGLIRKLYSTYLSYLPPEQFSYPILTHRDARGMFAEVLKTKDSGQFSFFTADVGVTRGGHYHHTKTEKFLVLQGTVQFNFKHIVSGETYKIITSSTKLEIVETPPGWSHSITNISTQEIIVMLWANEIFDPNTPDTISYKI
jgi:UDP-2-acetamido-2,6-beta-L-arabino-hexul-4-ose reductase